MDGALAPEKDYPILFTADSVTAAFETYTMPDGEGAAVFDFSFIFDTITPPDALTYLIKDSNGAEIASGSLSASSKRDNLGYTVSMFGGSTIALAGNTTPSAKVLGVLHTV